MIYLMAWCLPSFLLSSLVALFARLEGRQKAYWVSVVLIGYAPLPVLAYLAMFGLSLMREVDMSITDASAFIVGIPFVGCSIGIAGGLVVASLKSVPPKS
ncbi:MAG TPA: hypothetical protein PKC48_07880 [Sphingorhabdus sp.]|jgi:hypothetical protein|uniref:hypothetical protein n=1 Tax=Sphingorhabdus sp. TaxID=1902408 RepID=UPI002C41E380|nr:hypothetical protein [Sphingorhabdus sp.]HMT41253.1 hypothetical protein [Sphingorhabdus sp.]HMU22193.1 hypothetical protein [Sphingorhabdus sp.]